MNHMKDKNLNHSKSVFLKPVYLPDPGFPLFHSKNKNSGLRDFLHPLTTQKFQFPFSELMVSAAQGK